MFAFTLYFISVLPESSIPTQMNIFIEKYCLCDIVLGDVNKAWAFPSRSLQLESGCWKQKGQKRYTLKTQAV